MITFFKDALYGCIEKYKPKPTRAPSSNVCCIRNREDFEDVYNTGPSVNLLTK